MKRKHLYCYRAGQRGDKNKVRTDHILKVLLFVVNTILLLAYIKLRHNTYICVFISLFSYSIIIEMYYLQSRYYDPEICRFINCDDVNYIGLTESEISYNPFSYCENNPINDSDRNGFLAFSIIGKFFVGAIIGLLMTYLSDLITNIINKAKNIFKMISSLGTYISGVLSEALNMIWGGGISGKIVILVGTKFIKHLADALLNKIKINWMNLLKDIIKGLISMVMPKFKLKVPKYIRDIKSQAINKGIKGTVKLMQYLQKQIKIKTYVNYGLSKLQSIIKTIIKGFKTHGFL